MLKHAQNRDSDVQIAERRHHSRAALRSVAYIELGENNGGLILNIAEGGIAVQSAETIAGDFFPQMRLRLPNSQQWIEAKGKLAWIGESRKEAGIQFVDLDNNARRRIQDWVSSTAFRPGAQAAMPPSEPINAIDSAEIDSMFPSEKSFPTSAPAPAQLRKPAGIEHSALDAGIAPGPVRRQRLPVTEAKTSLWNPASSVENSEQALEQPFHFQEAQYSPSAASRLRRDPFASIVADQAERADFGAPDTRIFRNAEASASNLRAHFKGLGYDPPPFEEPSGKGWIAAGGILLVLLVVGTVLAMGPQNVRGVLTHYISSAIASASLSTPTPPPPERVSGKTQTAPEADPADTTAPANSAEALDSSSQQSILNPGVVTQPPEQPRASAVQNNDIVRRQDSGAVPPTAPPPPRAEARPQEPVSSEPAEDAEAITRRFQMEHSNTDSPTSVRPLAANIPSAPASAPSAPPTHSDKTLDAYAHVYDQPSPAPPNSAGTGGPAPAPGLASPAPALPSGTVAISSHFRSLRGEDPQLTLARRGLAVGQLASIHQPTYPVEAERARIEGTVQLRATVDQAGRVEIVQALGGPPILIPAAVEAVRQWRYAQTILSGRAMESVHDVSVAFRLANSAASPR